RTTADGAIIRDLATLSSQNASTGDRWLSQFERDAGQVIRAADIVESTATLRRSGSADDVDARLLRAPGEQSDPQRQAGSAPDPARAVPADRLRARRADQVRLALRLL